MIRILLALLAIIAIIASLPQILGMPMLGMPILTAAGAILMLIVIIMWVAPAKSNYDARKRPTQKKTIYSKEDDLKSLGIVSIRPKKASTPPPKNDLSAKQDSPENDQQTGPTEFSNSNVESGIETHIRESVTDASEEPSTDDSPQAPKPPDNAKLAQFLETARVSLGAHSTCLLRQSKDTLGYLVVSTAGQGKGKQVGETFNTNPPLITLSHSRHRQTVVRNVDKDQFPARSLVYSATPGVIRQVAIAPVNDRSYFLLADTTKPGELSHPQAKSLLESFAHTLGILIGGSDPVKSTPPPRRMIIKEEISNARRRGEGLALAIVYLNRAEDIAARSTTAVNEAENHLRTILQEVSGNNRVVRFGELMFAVFQDDNSEKIEAWNKRVHSALAAETGILEGGISIGIALLSDRNNTPEALRSEAARALEEAYKSGTPTVMVTE